MGHKLPCGTVVTLFMRRGQDSLAITVLLAEIPLPLRHPH